MSEQSANKFVCRRCFLDEHIAAYIASNGERGQCSFCTDSLDRRLSANVLSLENVFEFLKECVLTEYDEPHPDFVPIDTDTGEFLDDGETFNSILDDVGADCQHSELEDLLNDLAGPMFLTRQTKFTMSVGEYLLEEWDEYSRKVVEGPISLELLERLSTVTSFAVDLMPIRTIPTSASIFRARTSGSFPQNARFLGTTTNLFSDSRFVSRGQTAFYGALDSATAVREVIRDAGHAVVGRWHAGRALRLVDLSSALSRISIFDQARSRDRDKVNFLAQFADAIASPVVPGESGSYIPTQLFFKELIFAFREEAKIDGLLYRSSRVAQGECCVIFVPNRFCFEKGEPRPRGKASMILQDVETLISEDDSSDPA